MVMSNAVWTHFSMHMFNYNIQSNSVLGSGAYLEVRLHGEKVKYLADLASKLKTNTLNQS